MGCQSTACKVCGKHVPACQLANGICGTCRAEAAKKEKEAQEKK